MAAEKEKLLKELKTLLKDVPVDGLKYLIKQTNILIYNEKVDDLNEAAKRLKGGESENNQQTVSSEDSVRVERTEGSQNMILVVNNERKIMDQEEMIKMVRIAHTADNEKEGMQQLYRWLKRERDDILLDTGLTPNNNRMGILYRYLKTNFAVRD